MSPDGQGQVDDEKRHFFDALVQRCPSLSCLSISIDHKIDLIRQQNRYGLTQSRPPATEKENNTFAPGKPGLLRAWQHVTAPEREQGDRGDCKYEAEIAGIYLDWMRCAGLCHARASTGHRRPHSGVKHLEGAP